MTTPAAPELVRRNPEGASLTVVDVETGLWCDRCQRSTRVRIPLSIALMDEDGVTALEGAAWEGCTECDWPEDLPR